jgi:hypothetical protein
MPPQTAAAPVDDWGDTPTQAKPDERFEWGDEGQEPQAQPPAAKAAPAEQPGIMRRFWAGVKHGTGDNSDTPPSHGTWSNPDFADNLMLPGSGVYRDIKSGNYASAAGRVLGPAAELALMVGGGRTHAEPPPERIPLWKQVGIEPGAPPSSYDATPMTPQPVHTPSAQTPPSAPVGPRIPLWQRAGIEPGPPPSTIDVAPSAPYAPVRPPRVTAAPAQPPVEAPFKRPDLPAPYSTENQAWRRYPAVDSAQDLAETKDIQTRVKDQAEGEQRNMLRRGTEEGFARNTRPRTAKGELSKQYQSAKPGAKSSGSEYPGVDLNSEKELTDLLKRSLELATKVKPRK